MAQVLDGQNETVAEAAPPAAAGPRPAFFAKTATPLEWRLLAAAVKTVAEKATFRAGPEGLTFLADSPDHFRRVAVDWPAAAFHRYECPEPTTMSVVVEQFANLMARAGAADAVEVSKTANGLFKISFRGDRSKNFELHLVEDQPETKAGKIDLPASATFAPGVFSGTLADMAVVGDTFSLEVETDLVVFEGGSAETGSARLDFPAGDPGLVKLAPGPAGAKARYSIEQVSPVLKAFKDTAPTEVSIGQNRPMRLRFPLNDKGAAVTCFIAPRMEGGGVST